MAHDPDLLRRIEEWNWFHTIDLGDGLTTKGHAPSQIIAGGFPDVAGKSVLDIGAWDGKYSFDSERAGAERVVALDHYIWRLDHVARAEYYDKCAAEGILPDPEMIDRGFLMDSQYGKTGFDLAHAWLDSKVEAVVEDFATMDLAPLGTFDVVLYFGVLYHMVDPIGSLRRLRSVTKEVAVIETAAVSVPGYEHESISAFFSGDELHADHGNWFAPNERALHGMCRSAGFRKVETKGTTARPFEPVPTPEPPAASRKRWPRAVAPAPVSVPAAAPGIDHCRLLVYAYP